MENYLLLLIVIFQVFLLFFLGQDPGGNETNTRTLMTTRRYGAIPLPPGSRHKKITRLEKLQLKMINKQCSIVLNKTCLNNNLLAKYSLYIYIYICLRASKLYMRLYVYKIMNECVNMQIWLYDDLCLYIYMYIYIYIYIRTTICTHIFRFIDLPIFSTAYSSCLYTYFFTNRLWVESSENKIYLSIEDMNHAKIKYSAMRDHRFLNADLQTPLFAKNVFTLST